MSTPLGIEVNEPNYEVYPWDRLVIGVAGNAGVGKTTALREIFEPSPDSIQALFGPSLFAPHASVTDRPKREQIGETDTVFDHEFVSSDEFADLKADGGFLMTLAYDRYSYGIRHFKAPEPEANQRNIPVMITNPAIFGVVREFYPFARALYISDDGDTTSGMRARGDDEASIVRRASGAFKGREMPPFFKEINLHPYGKDDPEDIELAGAYLWNRINETVDGHRIVLDQTRRDPTTHLTDEQVDRFADQIAQLTMSA